jgi:hypothetical protein
MTEYWVVGGEYADTSFTRIAGGGGETRLGPFESHAAAKAEWAARAFASVDSALTRWRIEEGPGTSAAARFWVVGGEYKDTRFSDTADGRPETWVGPFASEAAARAEWAARSWASVDDALTCWRIETLFSDRPQRDPHGAKR